MIFRGLFIVFCFSFVTTLSAKVTVLDGLSFESQKISYSSVIRVWKYYINRSDIDSLKKFSKFGFSSEDDLIACYQFLVADSKFRSQSIQTPDIVSLVSVIEKSLGGSFDKNDFLYSPDSDVVVAFEYVIKKSNKDASAKVACLKARSSKDFSSIKSLYREIGEVSVLVFPNSSSLRSGSVIVLEDRYAYRVYYIASDPYQKSSISNVKVYIKDCLLNMLENLMDPDCFDIEN